MLRLYRSLLALYPPPYRCEYGNEMLAVLAQLELSTCQAKPGARFWMRAREVSGLLAGALTEHTRVIAGFPAASVSLSRRSRMRTEFRFPKATPILMTVILVAVIMAIEKAKSISASLPPSSTPIPPLQPEHFSTVTTFLEILALALSAAVVGWLAVFALRRSGLQRLSDVPSANASRKS
ncbi:MAG TPA: hypothetical protein VMJ35_01460 [Dongiaceae bacterium]|nr:hypothetical protein [Dongiaceae bacterium]